MKTIKSLHLIALSALFLTKELPAASIQINWSVDFGRELYNRFTTPLSAGTAINGDGTLIQLGFYTGATPSNPFLGSWVALATSSIGDTGVNEGGRFNVTTTLVEGNFNAPVLGTPLAIRYYDGFTAATSTFFNAVSDTTGPWNWVAPATMPPILDLKITKLTGVFQSGIFGAFQTAISTGVPEPALSALLVLSCGFWCIRHRRAKSDR